MIDDLDKRRSISELARTHDVNVRTLRRQLTIAHVASGGKLLQRLGTGKRSKWTTSYRCMQEHLPGQYQKTRASKEEVEQLRILQASTERKLEALTKEFLDFRKKAHDWFMRLPK